MKDFVLRVGSGVLAVLFMTTSAVASMVDNQSSLTADFTRMPARTASFDSSDTAIYNPAGTAWLQDGFHVGLSVKACLKEWQHTYDGTTYETTTPSFLALPNAVYRKGRLGMYLGTAVFGGLGIVDYDDGFVLIPGHPLDAILKKETEFTYLVPGLTTGVSWQLSDSLAVSGGVRVLYGIQEVEVDGGEVLDLSQDATGAAPVFGLSWKATDRLALSLRHEMRTKMEYEIDTFEGNPMLLGALNMLNGSSKGSKMRLDFPAQTAVGVMYRLTPRWRVAADGVVAWQKDADRSGAEENMGNGYYVAAGVEYDATPKWTLSLGYITCDPKDDLERTGYYYVNPKLEYQTVAAGVKYRHSDTLSFSLSAAPYFYDSYTTEKGVKMEKETLDISFGVEWLII